MESTLDSMGHDLWKKYNVMDDSEFVIFSCVYKRMYTLDSYWCIVGFSIHPAVLPRSTNKRRCIHGIPFQRRKVQELIMIYIRNVFTCFICTYLYVNMTP